jgi:hypothetical protein
MWAERRLLLVGNREAERDHGALVTFSVEDLEAPEETAFLAANLWLDVQGGF